MQNKKKIIQFLAYTVAILIGTAPLLIAPPSRNIHFAILTFSAVFITASLCTLIFLISKQRVLLQEELKRALKKQEFVVYYMPVIDLITSRCVSAEALIRWQHPQQGLLNPDFFVPLAEETRLIDPITHYLMRKVAEEMHEFLQQHRTFIIGINLCAHHFEDNKIIEASDKIFSVHDINPNQILYEITERTLIDTDTQPPHQVMHSMRQRKSSLALDDFGTGHSNLRYAQGFPLNYVKLDRGLISHITNSESAEKLATTLIATAKTLGIHIIAEGVETMAQADFLRAQDVRYVQGWYYSKALPANEFLEFIKEKL